MSSRNAFLSPDERRAARAIPRALEAARAAVESGERDSAPVVTQGLSLIRIFDGIPGLALGFDLGLDAGDVRESHLARAAALLSKP